MLNPRLQDIPAPIEKVVEKDAARLDVYLSSLAVKPWRVSARTEHLREATVELGYEVQVNRLKPNPSVVSLPIKRTVSERYSYDICEFGCRL